jgi:hypothetical protein
MAQIGTVNDISLHGYDTSAHPLDVLNLTSEGWVIFDIFDYNGSIGAFYFGPTPTIAIISYSANAHYLAVNPVIIHAQNAIPVSTAWGVYSIPSPNILTTNDITVDFIGIPRVGSSPLVVDFTATVTIAGGASGNVSIAEYHWYFDIVNNPTVYEISTGPTISHIYTGYYGQKFSVKLCVKLS